jgi:anti-sigma regulatory factor (Ser/Thr protein kinase)
VADLDERFELHVEGDPTGLSTIRVFVRAIARSVDADAERVDDLQLIVSEICSELLEAGGRELHVAVRRDEATLDVSVDGVGVGAAVSMEGEDKAFRRELLRSLAPDTAWGGAGARFRLTVPAASVPDR